ncbi:hypothetical protein [Hyphomicrobium sp.]|jgi:hypothetical protein|uniref:hypothetical protein n=1 Tax=Hyphomicrobium sp. TaxID=82 RepID=UPI002C62A5F3|nr:hypothetical protein [Hyphomicrobium sp.]HVZ03730.1 hypothetical protein [Hyphomicrobium sp.]
MDYVLAPFVWLLGTLVSIAFWLLTQLFWIVLWLVLPIVVAAFVALRIAERVLGQDKVRAWVRARTQTYGAAASKRAQRWLFALGVVPVRVLFWFVLYAIWHSVVSLLWRPRWTPWQRAWARRWRRQPQLETKA